MQDFDKVFDELKKDKDIKEAEKKIDEVKLENADNYSDIGDPNAELLRGNEQDERNESFENINPLHYDIVNDFLCHPTEFSDLEFTLMKNVGVEKFAQTHTKDIMKRNLQTILNRGGIPRVLDHVGKNLDDIGYAAQYLMSAFKLNFGADFTPADFKKLCESFADPDEVTNELGKKFFDGLMVDEKNATKRMSPETQAYVDYLNDVNYSVIAAQDYVNGRVEGHPALTDQQKYNITHELLATGPISPSNRDLAKDSLSAYVRLRDIHKNRPWHYWFTSPSKNSREKAMIKKMETALKSKLGYTQRDLKHLTIDCNVIDNISKAYQYETDSVSASKAIFEEIGRNSLRRGNMKTLVSSVDKEWGKQVEAKLEKARDTYDIKQSAIRDKFDSLKNLDANSVSVNSKADGSLDFSDYREVRDEREEKGYIDDQPVKQNEDVYSDPGDYSDGVSEKEKVIAEFDGGADKRTKIVVETRNENGVIIEQEKEFDTNPFTDMFDDVARDDDFADNKKQDEPVEEENINTGMREK